MIISKALWEEFFQGYLIRDCTYGFDDGRMGFYLVRDTDSHHLDDGWTTRFVAVNMAQPVDKRFFAMETDELSFAKISSAWSPSQTEFVILDSGRAVISYKPTSYDDGEEPIPFDGRGYGYSDLGEVGCAIYNLVRVNRTLYALGGPLRIFERQPGQRWREHIGIPIPAQLKSSNDDEITEALGDCMLLDMAGFSEAEMYAVGGGGAVWHFDGCAWSRLAFPTHARLHTVACGADGLVYITDIHGSLYRGRHAHWECLVRMDQSLPFTDSAWFAGRYWCANDYGMYVLEGNDLVPAHTAKNNPVPQRVAPYCHRIDVSPDGTRMLVCGESGAALCEDGRWNILFSELDFP